MKTQRPYLLDSSVLFKLFYREEEDADLAVRLRDGYLMGAWDIRIADLSLYETANALLYLKKFRASAIVDRIYALIALETILYGFSIPVLSDALKLSEEKGLSIYDAYLVSLAQREQLVFVTADAKLCRKFIGDASVLPLRAIPSLPSENTET